MAQTTIKERSKEFQKKFDYKVNLNNYILAHIDGRSFSKTIKKKFNQPFDQGFINLMDATAKYICENVQGCQLAFVQSDEITLLLKKNKPESDIFFGGRLCKMQSIIASMATAKFNQVITLYDIKANAHDYTKTDCCDTLYKIKDVVELIKDTQLYEFDCKVWDVENANDAFAWFLFRNIDCIRNSKNQTAQTYLSHNALIGKTCDEAIEFLKEEKGIDWNSFAENEKYGRFVIKKEENITNNNGVERLKTIWAVVPGCNLTQKDERENFLNKFFNFESNESN